MTSMSVSMASTLVLCQSPCCFLSNSQLSTFNHGFSTATKPYSTFYTTPANIQSPLKAMAMVGTSSFPLFQQPQIDEIPHEFNDGPSDVELRLSLGGMEVQSKEIHVDANESSLVVKVLQTGSVITLMEIKELYDKIKPSETIWYLDDDQLVINLRKHDQELKWPDIVESWESLSVGVFQLLKGTSIYLVGNSSEMNRRVAEELAVGLGYTPLDTKGLLETFAKQNIESWVTTEGSGAVAEAEAAVLENLSSHVRTVIATLGGKHGAAGQADKWRHLYAGFTVWLSKSEAADDSAKEEARKQVYHGYESYSKADVVVKFNSWEACHAKALAQASLSALKQLILSDKKLPGKKSLYIRLGCRGDWPNIKPPGWDPSTATDTPNTL